MSVQIRAVTAEDADAIATIYDHYVLESIATFEEEVVGAIGIACRIERITEAYPWLVACEEGRILGYAYAGQVRQRSAFRWAVETTIYLDRAACGRGVGRRLYQALLDCLRRQGFHQALAAIALPNAGSIALHRSLGFTDCGCWPRVGWKFDRWIDVAWYGLALQDDGPPGGEPRLPDAAWITVEDET